MGSPLIERGRIALVVAASLLANLVVLPDIAIAGTRADALLTLAIAGALVAGPDRGAVFAFVCGLVADLFVQTPFGLTALTYSVVAFGVGMVQAMVIRAAWWIPVAVAGGAAAAAVVLFALAGAVVGQAHLVSTDLFVVAPVVAATTAALTPLALRMLTWAWGLGERRELAV